MHGCSTGVRKVEGRCTGAGGHCTVGNFFFFHTCAHLHFVSTEDKVEKLVSCSW